MQLLVSEISGLQDDAHACILKPNLCLGYNQPTLM